MQISAIVFPQIRRDFAKSGKNIIGYDEIQPDLIKISPDLKEISLESGFLPQILEICRRILEILAEIQKTFGRFRFFGFQGRKTETETDPSKSVSSGKDPPPTHRPVGVVGLAGFGLDLVGFLGGSGYRINLDGPTNNLRFTLFGQNLSLKKKKRHRAQDTWIYQTNKNCILSPIPSFIGIVDSCCKNFSSSQHRSEELIQHKHIHKTSFTDYGHRHSLLNLNQNKNHVHWGQPKAMSDTKAVTYDFVVP